MSETDICQRFLINDRGLRGQWTLLEASYQTVLAKHDYPLEIQGLLGELLAASILLSATLKFEGTLSIQARGEGTINLLSVECTHDHTVRAIARWQGDTRGQSFRELLGKAILAITITPSQGERYQGIVPLDGDTVAQCLEHYFQSSEQLKTQIQLFHGNNRAGGLLLQALPGTGGSLEGAEQVLHGQSYEEQQEARAEEWHRVAGLAATLSAEELLNLDCNTVLYRLFHEEKVQVFAPEMVRFHCTCSRQRTASALEQIGREELDSILAERGKVDVTCQFCNEHYVFDPVDVAMLFAAGNPQADSSIN